MNVSIFISALLVTVSNFSFSQSSQSAALKLDVFPPTPNAAALGKFTDIQIGQSTGIPRISVPIYSYSGKSGLSLAISLDYHAGGVKVDEIASDVGLGWSLNYGGNVSRIVRGLPDDKMDVGYFFIDTLYSGSKYVTMYRNLYLGGPICFDTVYKISDWDNNWPAYQVDSKGRTFFLKTKKCAVVDSSFYERSDALRSFYNNIIDGQSDVFSYSLGGKSGKFIYQYGPNGMEQQIPQSRVKIKRVLDTNSNSSSRGSLIGFEIQDTDGTMYYFSKGDYIYSGLGGPMGSGFGYSSSWSLAKIVNFEKTDSIQFFYDAVALTYEQGTSETKFTKKQNYTDNTDLGSFGSNSFTGANLRIKQIRLPDGTVVDFSYNAIDRKDIQTKGALDRISITNKKLSYGFKLWQTYNNGTVPYSPAPPTVSSSLRLYLNSVSRFTGSENDPPYKFFYIGNLPDRQSNQVDFWGFHSSKASSTTMIPRMRITPDLQLSGSDRSPDSLNVSNGSLYKIVYPTGGEVNYEYQINRAGDDKLNFLDQKTVAVTTNVLTPSKTFSINRYETLSPIKFNFILTTWCPTVPTSGCSFVFRLLSQDGSVMYAQRTFSYTDLRVQSVVLNNFTNGTYRLEWGLSPSSTCTCNDNFGFRLSWNEYFMNTDQLCGGQRVKRIVQYDGIDHANDLFTEYSYLGLNGKSSGTVLSKPEFSYEMLSIDGDLPYENYIVRSSSLNTPLAFANGSPVIYGRVIEKRVKGIDNNGWTEYLNTSYKTTVITPCPDGGSGIRCFPFPIVVRPEFLLGLPLRESVYSKTGMLLQRNHFQYRNTLTDVSGKYLSIKFGKYCFATNEAATFTSIDFFPFAGRTEKVKERKVLYSSPTDSVETVIDYSYDPSFYTLKKQNTSTSQGKNVETRYYYPHDYSLTGAIGKLKNLGITDKLVAAEAWITDNGLTSMTGISITDFQEINNRIFPFKQYKLEYDRTLPESSVPPFNPGLLNRAPTFFKEQISYDQFDANGNLTQFAKGGSQINSILWGYNGQYPIAEIKNATTDQVAYTGFEESSTTSWNIPSLSRNTSNTFAGSQSYDLSNGAVTINSLLTTRSYRVSLWTTNSAILVNGSIGSVKAATAAGWSLIEMDLTNVTSITISFTGSALIDELRMHPREAQMSAYNYNSGIGLSSYFDARNVPSFFFYDSFGRLQYVKDHEGKIMKTHSYNYKK